MKWLGKHILCSYTCILDPLVLKMAQKVVRSVDNITLRPCAWWALFNSQQRWLNINRVCMDI